MTMILCVQEEVLLLPTPPTPLSLSHPPPTPCLQSPLGRVKTW
jgi:hypothetical protein